MPYSHRLSRSPMYPVWVCMKQRCSNPHNKSYKNYGARGISVCDEWINSYPAFYEWAIKSGYKKGLTIERIDNNKDYSPENCKWISKAAQSKNRRNVIVITYKGKTQCLADWARELGISRATIKSRLDQGRTVEEAFCKTDWRKGNGPGKKANHL